MPSFHESMEDAFNREPEIPQPKSAPDFRWQALFQRTHEPLFLLNRQRRFLFVNHAWEELTGLSAVEARGLQCLRRPSLPQDPWDLVIRAVCCPPPEVLHGKMGRARRLVPRTGAGPHWWDIEFLPVLEAKGLLGVLGKITALPASVAATPPLPEKLVALRERLRQRYNWDQLASKLPAFQRVLHQARLASQTATPVLLLGEPGTGKHWLARTIHYQSTMCEGVFAALDCARLPPELSAAVLFGDSSPGRRPCPGTRYLKEAACLSRELQMQLTACLGENEENSGPRFIAGCSSDVEEAIRSGRLVEEFACAFGTLSISLPPLRERLADFPLLVERFLERINSGNSRSVTGLTSEAWDVLRAYGWPGNLRELYMVIQSACQRTSGERIDATHLPAKLRLAVRLERIPEPLPEQPLRLDDILEQAERRLILSALRKANGNRSRAAELLSIWRPRLLRRMEALGINDWEVRSP
jgi:transcriptional regulator with PAS, ATPase and Fis domain